MQKNDVFSFIRYSNVWEDTDIALEGLGIKIGQTGAAVCSGGDNVLAMLAREPKKIYAFDLNETQLFCTELKIAAIRNLTLDETKCLLGVIDGERTKLYETVRQDMSKEAQKYFSDHFDLIEKGIIHVGKFEHYLQLFNKYLIPMTSSKKNYIEFAKMHDARKQREFYLRKIDTLRFRALFQIFFGYKMMAKYGRDKTFFENLDRDDVESNGIDLKRKIEYGISHVSNNTNLYLDYIVNNNFTHAFPKYLQPEYYLKIRKNLDKIELMHGTIKDLPSLSFDFLYLSDIFEYMDLKEFNENIEEIGQRIKNNGRVLYWNMQNRRYINHEKFINKKELSHELYKKNKTWFYRDLLIYEVEK